MRDVSAPMVCHACDTPIAFGDAVVYHVEGRRFHLPCFPAAVAAGVQVWKDLNSFCGLTGPTVHAGRHCCPTKVGHYQGLLRPYALSMVVAIEFELGFWWGCTNG